ncbi:MAG TPA: hypothetical protein VHL11_21690, partial [Phototrophicaceae bacterium]|nr:hypothetical protein [Phototrophicaceae bacterium]
RGAYGQALVSSSLPAVLTALRALNAEPPLKDTLDLNRLILAGHSAGGVMALMNAHRHLLPGVVAAISFFGNPLATTSLAGDAFTKGELPRLADNLPLLIIGGTDDGVSQHHNQIYGRPDCTSTDITLATLHEGIDVQNQPSNRLDRYAVVIEGASHYSIADPLDTTIGRTYLDNVPTLDRAECRRLLTELTARFISEHVIDTGNDETSSFADWLAAAPHIAALTVI